MNSMKQYKLTLQHDNGIVHIKVNATSEDNAKNIIMDVERCSLSDILEVKEVEDIQGNIWKREFKQFKDRVNVMTLKEFSEFMNVMFRTFNFINAVEDMDIDEVNSLQGMARGNANYSMTSKELMEFFNDKLSMDIE